MRFNRRQLVEATKGFLVSLARFLCCRRPSDRQVREFERENQRRGALMEEIEAITKEKNVFFN